MSNMDERVDKRVDEVINEFFTDCPYGRKAISGCPALSGHHGEPKKFSEDYANQFFNECPYGKRAQNQCPYGRRLSRDCSKYAEVGQNFMKCPSGRKTAEECPYGKEVLEKSKSYDHGKEIIEKARGYDHHHHHGGSSKHLDFAKEFFSECPYGKRATAECPYAREILARKDHTSDSTIHPHYHSKQFDEFFTECPYGRKAAEECPYGHEVLEKAGISVPPLKTHDASAKCPFASMTGDEKSKCPVGGVMPQSEKCPISPNYKKTFTPTMDFYENDKEFKLFFELPGIDKSDVKVDVKDKVLNLTAESKSIISDLANEKPYFTERKFGVYSRSISLPDNVCLKKVEAKMDNGILSITIPKGEPTVVTTITIK